MSRVDTTKPPGSHGSVEPRVRGSELRGGFTLVELLVVIAIIATLIGLLLPAVQSAREAARRTACQQNVRQLALGVHSYHDARQGFPAHFSPGGASPKTGVSWLCLVLPFIEQSMVFELIDARAQSYNGGPNQQASLTKIPTFYCPSYPEDRSGSNVDAFKGQRAYTAHYLANAGPVGTNPMTRQTYQTIQSSQGPLACEGVMPLSGKVVTANPLQPSPVRIKDVQDGTSKTIMAFEVAWQGLEQDPSSLRSWVRGICWGNDSTGAKNVRNAMKVVRYNGGSNWNDISMGGNHPAGCTVAMADASVRFLGETVDVNTVLLPLASRAGSETTAED